MSHRGWSLTRSPSKNYSFKCHRMDIAANSMPGTPAVAGNTSNTTSQQVFAVNDITFHKQFGTFVTAGSDGGFTIWDGQQKTKIKRKSPRERNCARTDSRIQPERDQQR